MNGKGVTVLLAALVGVQCLPSFSDRSQPVGGGDQLAGTAIKCKTCVQFTRQAGADLLNVILNSGVIGSCTELCGALSDKGQAAMCGRLCNFAGIQEFTQLFVKANLDSFYFCELLTVCPIFDDGDAKITQLSVKPPVAPQGKRTISYSYTSDNGTGTGEIAVVVQPPSGLPIGDSSFIPRSPPGTYSNKIILMAKPDPHCDPKKGPCQKWSPGHYKLSINVCYGKCGSSDPHSKIYDTREVNFVITS
ncbi:countin-3-like [Haliotis rubra]|uniref:countin-3-like n=1 Tax=Haliotis rubra TaxID=36100 RepID=UPI001EE572A6|nr:countin-3-like [Haliotis rubra]